MPRYKEQSERTRITMPVGDWNAALKCVKYWCECDLELTKGKPSLTYAMGEILQRKVQSTLNKAGKNQASVNLSGDEIVLFCNAMADMVMDADGQRDVLAPIATYLEKMLANQYGAHVWVHCIVCHVGVWGKQEVCK